MNIINVGNPSANNMIIREVMKKKRQSSATIFDKLNKRTVQLTSKNPLNNVITNDQLFRYTEGLLLDFLVARILSASLRSASACSLFFSSSVQHGRPG